MPRIADEVPHVMQVSAGFEQAAERGREPMQALQIVKQIVGEPRHALRMPQGNAVALRHTFHHGALLRGEAADLAPRAARRQIRDDAIPHTRDRIKQRRHAERFE